MEPGFLVATGCRCDSHMLYRLVGVNVRVRRVNLTLLCWCRVSNVLFWPIIPDMIAGLTEDERCPVGKGRTSSAGLK